VSALHDLTGGVAPKERGGKGVVGATSDSDARKVERRNRKKSTHPGKASTDGYVPRRTWVRGGAEEEERAAGESGGGGESRRRSFGYRLENVDPWGEREAEGLGEGPLEWDSDKGETGA